MMLVDFTTFRDLYITSKKYADNEKFIFEVGWKRWMHGHSSDEIILFLRTIYNVSHDGLVAIMSQYKNMKQMSEVLTIPYSTVQKWKSGLSTPAEHLILLMAYATAEKVEVLKMTNEQVKALAQIYAILCSIEESNNRDTFASYQRVLLHPMIEITRMYKKNVGNIPKKYERELSALFDTLDADTINDVLTEEQRGVFTVEFEKKKHSMM